MWLIKLVFFLAAAYAGVAGSIYAGQTWLLFPTRLATAAGPPLPAAANRLEVETPDGERLHGVHLPPADGPVDGATLVLGFGGNAWNADGVAEFLRQAFPRAHVAAFHYRGYAPSTGRPSAEALLSDAPVVYDHVVQAVGAEHIVAVGFSIGAGVAAQLAKRRPVAGLILVSPFDSLTALAREHYFWLPVGLLMRHRMPVLELLEGSAVPTAVIAAEHDTIVPPRRTEPVRQAISELVLDRTVMGAGHNDLYHHIAFRDALAEALARIEARARAAANAAANAADGEKLEMWTAPRQPRHGGREEQ